MNDIVYKWVKASEGAFPHFNQEVYLMGCRINKGLIRKEKNELNGKYYINIYDLKSTSKLPLTSLEEGHKELFNIEWLKQVEPPTNINKWVSVEDDLPKVSNHYTVYGKIRQSMGMWTSLFNGEKFLTTKRRRVTHWMPLPSAPNENKTK